LSESFDPGLRLGSSLLSLLAWCLYPFVYFLLSPSSSPFSRLMFILMQSLAASASNQYQQQEQQHQHRPLSGVVCRHTSTRNAFAFPTPTHHSFPSAPSTDR
jgi:hypothetical protein